MRNRYLDLLRAVAIVRVVVYHVTGWSALTIVFPAMPVMFALAGSLMAASIDKAGPVAIGRRLRRLLPSLWVIAGLFVPAMLLAGLAWDWGLLMWALPLLDPPANEWGAQALSANWYLRDFLWFVLLSPVALWLFRRRPLLTLAAPYLVLLAIEFAGWQAHVIVRDFGLYFGAWLLGFAHHDGLLTRLGRRRLLAIAAALATTGATWIWLHPGPRGYDLNDIHLGNALWAGAFILVALGCAPDAARFEGAPRWWHRPVTVLNARALTIYLWHVPILVGVTRWGEHAGWPILGAAGIAWRLAVVVAGVVLAVALFGWVEDVAGHRRPSLLPGGRRATAPRTHPAVRGTARPAAPDAVPTRTVRIPAGRLAGPASSAGPALSAYRGVSEGPPMSTVARDLDASPVTAGSTVAPGCAVPERSAVSVQRHDAGHGDGEDPAEQRGHPAVPVGAVAAVPVGTTPARSGDGVACGPGKGRPAVATTEVSWPAAATPPAAVDAESRPVTAHDAPVDVPIVVDIRSSPADLAVPSDAGWPTEIAPVSPAVPGITSVPGRPGHPACLVPPNHRHDAHRREAPRHDVHRHDAHRHDVHRHDARRREVPRHDVHRHDARRHDVHRHDGRRHEGHRHEVHRNGPPRDARGQDPRRPPVTPADAPEPPRLALPALVALADGHPVPPTARDPEGHDRPDVHHRPDPDRKDQARRASRSQGADAGRRSGSRKPSRRARATA